MAVVFKETMFQIAVSTPTSAYHGEFTTEKE
jgi:hypothetical protein